MLISERSLSGSLPSISQADSHSSDEAHIQKAVADSSLPYDFKDVDYSTIGELGDDVSTVSSLATGQNSPALTDYSSNSSGISSGKVTIAFVYEA